MTLGRCFVRGAENRILHVRYRAARRTRPKRGSVRHARPFDSRVQALLAHPLTSFGAPRIELGPSAPKADILPIYYAPPFVHPYYHATQYPLFKPNLWIIRTCACCVTLLIASFCDILLMVSSQLPEKFSRRIA
jgi:hypothetical protein